jgi:hypothetical protein
MRVLINSRDIRNLETKSKFSGVFEVFQEFSGIS